MKTKPKITVIVPVYCAERYIEQCARSLFEQTLEGIEYIFVNDCTPDNSMGILYSTINAYPKIKEQVIVINMPKNSGQALVRKTAIENAHGEYLIHCDSDDWVEVDAYEKMYTYAETHKCDMTFMDYYKSVNGVNTPITVKASYNDHLKLMEEILMGKVKGSLCFTLIRKSLYNKNFTHPLYDMTEDMTSIVQLLFNASKIGYVNESLYFYRQNSSSITKTISFDNCMKKFNDSYGNICMLEKFFSDSHYNLSSKILDVRKLDCKNLLLPITNRMRGYLKWLFAFNEINIRCMCNSEIPLNTKLRFCITIFGLYPLKARISGYKMAK